MTYVAGPFNGAHLYCQWGGTLPGGEEWSNGIRFAPTPGFTAVYESAMHTAVSTAIEAFHSRGNTLISSRAILTFVKLNLINPDGHYAEAVTHEHVSANIAGGSTVSTPPNQVCLAISLTTGVSRGPAHRGRFYMPLPAMPVQTDGRISAGDAANVQASATTLLSDLNAASAHYNVAVFSRKAGSAADRVVTGVAVGRVLDTQRRRRNKLAEAY